MDLHEPRAHRVKAPHERSPPCLVYVIAGYVLFLVTLPVLLTHPKLRHGVAQRLGLYRRGLELGRGSPRIWLHGASAGDLLSLQPMMRELRRRLPDSCIIVTTITNSGLEMARKKLAEADVVLYAPYDLFGATPVARSRRSGPTCSSSESTPRSGRTSSVPPGRPACASR